ncbi:MAG TPA: cyclic nucleotide-binding domain-containing protein, partial [Kofleriaceae bacterium]
MARDIRKLRDEAHEATASGKYKRALVAYLELERFEPRDAQWSKRAAETYRRLGKDKDAIEAYARAADRYAQNGFLVQAIAVCKLIVQMDPKNDEALRRIAAMNEQIGAGPTRAVVIAEHNPALADSAAVNALRSSGTGPQPSLRRSKISSAPPLARTITPQQLKAATATPPQGVAVSRTKSKPITLAPGRAIESVDLNKEVPNAFEREESSGIYVIPIDGEPELELEPFDSRDRSSMPRVEVEAPEDQFELAHGDVEESTELELADIEEIPLPEPRVLGAAAAATLASTPLFAGLSRESLESLVAELELVTLKAGETLFYEGDPGDALYVIVEGEVAVQAEGPPRVEMARL